MHQLTGGCHCGNIRVEIALPRPPGDYSPRACDCDFCRKHGASYLSDPHGSLLIRIEDERDGGRYHQGSGTADCLLCRRCGVLIGATFLCDERLYAAVNVRILDGAAGFAAELPVSPKKLSQNEKAQRWQTLWFADVSVVNEAGLV